MGTARYPLFSRSTSVLAMSKNLSGGLWPQSLRTHPIKCYITYSGRIQVGTVKAVQGVCEGQQILVCGEGCSPEGGSMKILWGERVRPVGNGERYLLGLVWRDDYIADVAPWRTHDVCRLQQVVEGVAALWGRVPGHGHNRYCSQSRHKEHWSITACCVKTRHTTWVFPDLYRWPTQQSNYSV